METISFQKQTIAKKEHRCDFCCEKIKPGESYYLSTHKQDGQIYSWKTHIYCADIADRLNMYKDCDEGLSADGFQECIHNAHDDLLIAKLPEDKIKEYSDIIQQLRHVNFRYKLTYVIRYYNNLDKHSNQ